MFDMRKDYLSIIKICKELLKNLENVLEKEEADSYLEFFDILLQYSLIETVIVDLRFTDKECKFIQKFRDYGDLVLFLNKNGYTQVTWDNIADKNITNIVKILDEARVGPLADGAGIFVATTTIGLEHDLDKAQYYFDELVSHIDNIFLTLIDYDVDTNKELIELGASTPLMYALNYIAKETKLRMSSPFRKNE